MGGFEGSCDRDEKKAGAFAPAFLASLLLSC
jgi:hypothetical protein